uniref:RING-type domain-containing protein n=1 Tax=viral metagenome TaxID=1070528 RepID=A0A6C0CR77_9ZZZZ
MDVIRAQESNISVSNRLNMIQQNASIESVSLTLSQLDALETDILQRDWGGYYENYRRPLIRRIDEIRASLGCEPKIRDERVFTQPGPRMVYSPRRSSSTVSEPISDQNFLLQHEMLTPTPPSRSEPSVVTIERQSLPYPAYSASSVPQRRSRFSELNFFNCFSSRGSHSATRVSPVPGSNAAPTPVSHASFTSLTNVSHQNAIPSYDPVTLYFSTTQTTVYETDTCAICLDKFGEKGFVYVSCGHKYHETCIRRWIRIKSMSVNSKKLVCPTCNTILHFNHGN